MNKLKSLFIGIFPMFAMAAIIWSIIGLISEPQSTLLWGIILINGPIMFLISKAMMFQTVARTSPKLLPSLGISSFGLGLVVQYIVSFSNIEIMPLTFAVCGYLGMLLYVFWYSVFNRTPSKTIQEGAKLPDVSFEDPEGKQVSASSFKGQPTVFMFFRGNWCPLCMAQIKELVAEYKRLDAMGAKVVLVSPQDHKKTAKLAARFDVNFIFLTDPDLKAGKELGIFMKNGLPFGMSMLGYDNDTLYPTVIVTNSEGEVVFHDQTDNYRVRPEPETFLRVIEGL